MESRMRFGSVFFLTVETKFLAFIAFAILFSALPFCASAQIKSDIQAGFSFTSQREDYTDSGTDFSNKTYRFGAEIANFNTFQSGFGFFELLNFQFFRRGTAKSSLTDDTDYGNDPFFALDFFAGPAFVYSLNRKKSLQVGIGFHWFYQYWKTDGFTFADTDAGAGVIFNYKYKLSRTISLILGGCAYFDFYCSKSYIYDNVSYSIPADDFTRIGIEPHLLLSIDF